MPIKTVGQATTDLITAFGRADEVQSLAGGRMNGHAADLAVVWEGAASVRFTQAMDDWNTGLNRVTMALRELQTAMVAYSQSTEATEDNNLQTVTVLATPGQS